MMTIDPAAWKISYFCGPRNAFSGLLFLLLLAAPVYAASPETETGAPEALRPWTAWVLHGQEEAWLCPPDPAGGRPRCAWPVSLDLDLTDRGGRFVAVLELKKEMAFPLPGEPGAWPRNVTLADGSAAPVLGLARPEVFLPAGRHILTGLFQWPRLPETLSLPLGFVLKLKVNGREPDFPPVEVDYAANSVRLWLKAAPGGEETRAETADRLTVTVNRLIEDAQPMMIKTRLKLVVSGAEREATLGQALLPETKAISLSSPLPARLTEEGLRVRLKPGVYELFLDSRAPDRAETLGPAGAEAAEFWAFRADADLRLAEISGAEQIDPSQADFYSPWKAFPIYAVPPGGSLTFATLRRGDPDPPPDQLRLNRECWLDFSGQGLSCRDDLSGLLSRGWRLNVGEPFTLAQASLNGEPQVITWQTDSRGRPAPGLQLREGRLNLSADLRLENFSGLLPASGWDRALETEGQKINLPPGYRLLHVSGAESRLADGEPASWTENWSVLDFFLVLLISIAAGRLYGPAVGAAALAALVLSCHEPLAPRLIFPHLLVTAALLRKIPPGGKLQAAVKVWRLAACLVLIVQATLFVAQQARLTLHPQLEKSYSPLLKNGYSPEPADARFQDEASSDVYEDVYEEYEEPRASAALVAPAPVMKAEMSRAALGGSASRPAPPPRQRMALLNQAPDAKAQNSVPRPIWSWNSARLYYNGAVGAEQETRLWLAGPAGWRLWGFLRLSLTALLSWRLISGRRFGFGRLRPRPAGAALALAALISQAGPALAQGDFPTRDLLETYKTRLLERKSVPPPSLARLSLIPAAGALELDFIVEAGREEIFPLPALDREIFRPVSLILEGQGGPKNLPLLEAEGRWLTLVPAGRSRLVFKGALKKASAAFQSFSLSFPPEGWPQFAEAAENPDWRVEGLEPDGRIRGGTLLLTAARLTAESAEDSGAETPERTELTLSPFFQVRRVISLGLDWRATTTVRRLTPLGAPAALELPLLPGENPVSGGVRVQNGRATIHFGPRDETVAWESSLETAPEIILSASPGPWTETWELDASPIWEVEPEGLIPIHYVQDGLWQPQWRPWPGETLRLTVRRPQPVPGRYLVADLARLALTIGETAERAKLDFQIRTSQGGPFSFALPAGAEIREFTVDGSPVPLGGASAPAAAPSLTAFLGPGTHNLDVRWSLEKPLGLLAETPALNLNLPTANVSAALTLPESRWVLWAWGPLSGPAVQFWSLLAVTLLASLFLGRLKEPPLSRKAWFLLSWGLLQNELLWALPVVGWFLALAWRRRRAAAGRFRFNARQVGLVLLTAAALWSLFHCVKLGLLQNPDMLIAGGGSYGQHLQWFVDRTDGPWPQGRVLSISIWYYKALMLAWSLWLAASLISWLKWAWAAFAQGGLWRPAPPRRRRRAAEPGEASGSGAPAMEKIKKERPDDGQDN